MLLGLNKIATDNGFIVKGMAEGGVAAKNLEEETGIPSSTVAKFKLDEQKLQNEISAVGGMDRKNEIWVVDESSFSGQESFAEILKLSKNANARVVFLGDKLQMQSIAAGKPFEVLQDKMAKSEMQNINRQKTDDLKEVVALITAKNEKGDITLSENQKAFDLLDKQGNVIKHKQEELHSKLVESYMSKSLEERNNSLIITPFNADRELINDMVRERKKEAGELSGEEHHISVLVNKNLTKAQQTNYREYEKGDVVRFNKEYKIDENTKVEKDHYYKVMGSYTKKDGQKEEGLILQDKNGNLLNWKTKNKNLVEVYKEKEKELQKGDLIKINRSNGDFKNGEKYSFHEIRGNEVILRNEKGHEKVMPKEEFKHWDHGYANTIYSSQGLTKSSVFMLINSETLSNAQNSQKAIKNLGKIFGNRAFYVGVTRASQELKIFTHDKDVARGAVAYEQDKTSFVQDGNTLGQQDQQVSQKGFDMEI
jgi:ATP-dependent exoDNAse (exonuclease V) alpha subunit